MKSTLTFLFLYLFPISGWNQTYRYCDSLFFTDGSIAVVDSIKAVQGSFRYRLCGEKYGPLYEIKVAGLKKIRYRSGAQELWYSENNTLDKVEKSLVPEPQDTSQTWHIEMLDGNDYYGNILRKEEPYYVFRTFDLGVINIPYGRIKHMSQKALPRLVGDKYWLTNPHATRYFFGTNGYGLKEGEGYYTNTWLFYNYVSYGISNRFALGFGTVPLFLFGEGSFPFGITPKVSFPLGRSKWNGAAGIIYMNAVGSDVDESSGIGVPYGSLTYGSTDQNATISFGYAINDGQWEKRPILSFNALDRVGRKSYLITENYLLTIEGYSTLLVSAGGRWVGKRIAFDYAFVRPFLGIFKGTGFYFFPWLSITAVFGK